MNDTLPSNVIEVADVVGLTFTQPHGGSLPIVKGKKVLKTEQFFSGSAVLHKEPNLTGIVLDVFPVAHEYKIGLKQTGYHYSQGFHILVGEPSPIVVYYEEGWNHVAFIQLLAKGNGDIVFDPTENHEI